MRMRPSKVPTLVQPFDRISGELLAPSSGRRDQRRSSNLPVGARRGRPPYRNERCHISEPSQSPSSQSRSKRVRRSQARANCAAYKKRASLLLLVENRKGVSLLDPLIPLQSATAPYICICDKDCKDEDDHLN